MKYIQPSFQIQCRLVVIPYSPVAFAARLDCIDGIAKARTCVCVKELPLGTDVEIECIAAVKGDQKEDLVMSALL